jgi:aerobic-type carbon monoxide dehydrogenase small subunit (CoxS/CutS family)
MSDVTILVDDVPRRVRDDVTVAVALLDLGVTAFRRSIGGAPRAPVCGMGSCHECRVTIDGRPGVRSCLEPVREGMRVESNR